MFVGLPEKTSTSASSNGFFNTPDEIHSVHLGDAAIALFQQATNGFSLGGAAFSVGLKGSMPLTTLVLGENLRKTIWANVLSNAFLLEKAPELLNAEIQKPTWVIAPHTSKQENALHIGLLRGLFWQPAKIKLEVKNSLATGFFKNTGMCSVPGFWQHPHTPIDMLRLHTGNAKEKPFLSARNDLPLWGQMLSFFYTQQVKVVETQQEGTSCALVVQQYKDNSTWRGRDIKLAIGGYVKGGSAESLAGRKHETYSLATDWENRSAEMDRLIIMGLDVYKKLDWAMNEFARIAIDKGKHKAKESGFKKAVKGKAKQAYFDNSESLMHSILRKWAWDEDIAPYQKQFADLARTIFDQILAPYEHEPKMLQAIIESRVRLNYMLNKMGVVHE